MAYNSHYLTNVIFRIDFVSAEESIRNELTSSVRDICVKYFPIPEARTVETKEIVVTNGAEQQNTVVNCQKSTEWHFWGKNREKELAIMAECMFVDFRNYNSFSEFKSEFLEIFHTLQIAYADIKINRIGLRYIDQIDLVSDQTARKSWFSYWKKYINTDLIQGLSFADDDSAITRHMCSLEMNYGECMLHFQYGMHNQDYPAPNKKKIFIIDTDIYELGLFAPEDIEHKMDIYHERAKDWFERAIKDPLRTKMGVVAENG